MNFKFKEVVNFKIKIYNPSRLPILILVVIAYYNIMFYFTIRIEHLYIRKT